MYWRDEQPIAMGREVHFDGRVVWCFRDRPRSVWEMFCAQAQRFGEADALVDRHGRLSYAELAERAQRVAGGLADAGVGQGDRVALVMGNRFAFVEVWLACQVLGAICVPLNPRQTAPEIIYATQNCGAVALIFDAALFASIPSKAEIPSIQHLWSAYGTVEGAETYESLISSVGQPADVEEEDCATILYTSGTTGRPKGAMLTHLGIIHSSLHFVYAMEMKAGDRSLLAVPASHVTGLIANISSALACGAAIVLLDDFKAGNCLNLMARERVTHTLIVPAMYNLFLLEPGFENFDLDAWRIGGYGGAPMPEATIAEMAERAPHVGLMNGYGATEATSPTAMTPAHCAASHADCVGPPLHCTEVGVFDPQGREVPTGTQGEIWMSGPNVIPGYWDDPAANAANFVGGYWKSGDVGSMTSDGFVRLHDRIKDMLNRGGYKVYSVEVESQLSFHTHVLESAIVGSPCPVLGERVHAVIVPKGAAASEALANDIKAFAAKRLSDYKVPEVIHFRDTPLPRNANGKILKTKLREEYT